MNSKHNESNILSLLTVIAIATLFASTLSQVRLIEAKEILEPTIDNRLAKVREQLKQINRESDNLLSLPSNLVPEQDKTIQAQYWYNYQPWSNWSNYQPWSNWSDWSDWNNWNNWSNYGY